MTIKPLISYSGDEKLQWKYMAMHSTMQRYSYRKQECRSLMTSPWFRLQEKQKAKQNKNLCILINKNNNKQLYTTGVCSGPLNVKSVQQRWLSSEYQSALNWTKRETLLSGLLQYSFWKKINAFTCLEPASNVLWTPGPDN